MKSPVNEAISHCRIGLWTPKRYSRSRIKLPFAKTTARLLAYVERRAGK